MHLGKFCHKNSDSLLYQSHKKITSVIANNNHQCTTDFILKSKFELLRWDPCIQTQSHAIRPVSQHWSWFSSCPKHADVPPMTPDLK